jgi:F0F1-type ATP synthase epsilon subunit
VTSEQVHLQYRLAVMQRSLDQSALEEALAKAEAEIDRLRLSNERLRMTVKDQEHLLRLYQ